MAPNDNRKGINPVGTVRIPYKMERPDVVDVDCPSFAEYVKTLTTREAIPYLRVMAKSDEETFPWPLVERYVKDSDEHAYPSGELPEPKEGYRWYYVSSMAKLSGMGGWLEVNQAEKRQGRFIQICRS